MRDVSIRTVSPLAQCPGTPVAAHSFTGRRCSLRGSLRWPPTLGSAGQPSFEETQHPPSPLSAR